MAEQKRERDRDRARQRHADNWGGRITREGSNAAPAALGLAGRLLPALLIIVGVLFNLTTKPELTGSPFFAAAPLVAAPFTTTRVTALTGLISVAVLSALVVVRPPGNPGEISEPLVQTLTVVVVGLLAIGISRLLRRSGAALASARFIAEAAQFAVLPVPPSLVGALEVAARYKAAQADARIGGDFYAVQETPHGVRLLVGDVRGKGLDAVEAVVIVIGAFREAAEQETTLEAVAERLERALSREGTRRRGLEEAEGFTTAAIAEIPAASPGVLRIVNRGHPAPLLLTGGRTRYVDATVPALPLGLSELGRWPDRADEVPFPPGTQLLLYTDGLSEARDRSGAFFEPDKDLSGRVFDDPEALLDAVLADVQAHTGGASADDMALMAVQRTTVPD